MTRLELPLIQCCFNLSGGAADTSPPAGETHRAGCLFNNPDRPNACATCISPASPKPGGLAAPGASLLGLRRRHTHLHTGCAGCRRNSLGTSTHNGLPHMANKTFTSIPAPGWPRRPIRRAARPAASPCSPLPRWLRHPGTLSHTVCASTLCRHSTMFSMAMSTPVRECRFLGLGTSCRPGGNRRSPWTRSQ